MSPDLDAAIAGLYDAFAHRAAPAHVAGCPHCIEDADHARLTAHPLRQLTTADVHKYASRAMSTWGTAADFAYFVPRLLELLAREPGAWTDPELLLGKLELAGWRSWSADEIAAIERYAVALWRAVLATYPARIDAGLLLRGLGRLLDDLAPLLAIWDADPGVAALRHLAAFVLANRDALWRTGSLFARGWRAPQLAQVVAWLRRPAIVERLERGFFAHAGQAYAGELSLAHECLVGLAAAS
jgi:hypothetical protein